MEIDAVAFPALIVADDGWVEYAQSALSLSKWTTSAIRKYNGRRVLLYDHSERVWLAESIAPRQRRNSLLALTDPIRNPRVAVNIGVRPVTEDPRGAALKLLLAAIDANDDILTQKVEALELKRQILNASSFDAMVQVLRSTGTIEV